MKIGASVVFLASLVTSQASGTRVKIPRQIHGFKLANACTYEDEDTTIIASSLEECAADCVFPSCGAFRYAVHKNCTHYRSSDHLVDGPHRETCYVRVTNAASFLGTKSVRERRLEGLDDSMVCSTSDTCPERHECIDKICSRQGETVDVVMRSVNRTDNCITPTLSNVEEKSIITAAMNASGGNPQMLRTSDFSAGFFEIKTSGYYKFAEDITIPWTNDVSEKPAPNHLGQTIGIRVTAPQDVVIDLNGFSLQMNKHAVKHEVFMNLIQLNNNNFPEGKVGFGAVKSANRVVVFSSAARKGVVKHATHFCISGMKNTDVVIRNLRLEHCDVGGISMTDARNLLIKDVIVDNSNLKIKWIPYFAVLLQLRMRLYQIVTRVTANAATSDIGVGEWTTMRDFAEGKVRRASWIKNPMENRAAGNSFGIQVKNLLNEKADGGHNVQIENTVVNRVMVAPSEVMAIRGNNNNVLMDADSNVFEFDHFFTEEGTMKVCPTANDRCDTFQKLNKMRLEVVKYFCSAANKPVGILCTPGIHAALTNSANHRPVSGADVRGHIPKGAFGIRFVGVNHAELKNVDITGVDNVEVRSRSAGATHNQYESPALWRGQENTHKVFKGAMAFGFYCEHCKSVMMKVVRSSGIASQWGTAIGFGAGNEAENIIFDTVTSRVQDPSTDAVSGQIVLPNLVPVSLPFFIEESTQCVEFRGATSNNKVLGISPTVDCETQAQESELCMFFEGSRNATTNTTTTTNSSRNATTTTATTTNMSRNTTTATTTTTNRSRNTTTATTSTTTPCPETTKRYQ